MPLFGRASWAAAEIEEAIRSGQVFFEMPEPPLVYKHALRGGRSLAIRAVSELGLLESSVGHVEMFGDNCDIYLTNHGLPFVASDRDILSKERGVLDAARLTSLRRHFVHMVLQLGVDVALTLGAARAGWPAERTGEIGSPRWNAAQVVVAASGTKTVFDNIRRPTWTAWTKIVLHTAHSTMPMPDLGRTNAEETLERLFPRSLSGEAHRAPDLCECGCAVRFAIQT